MTEGILDINAIRFSGERGAFYVLLLASLITLAVIITAVILAPAASLVFVFYIGIFLLISWLAKIFAMASIRGHGIHVTEHQYPQIYEYVRNFSTRLQLAKPPEVYVMQATLMNAFAIKVIGRRYVILYSHLVDAALEGGDYDEVAMILGHEMAHHAAGHVRWHSFLALGFWLPFLYSFWSRRAEYTSDRAGMLLVSKLQPSLQGIVKLAVGRKLAASINLSELRQQRDQVSGELAPNLVEIFSSHPLTLNRIVEMEAFAQTHTMA